MSNGMPDFRINRSPLGEACREGRHQASAFSFGCCGQPGASKGSEGYRHTLTRHDAAQGRL
jgi:hypothetical protein